MKYLFSVIVFLFIATLVHAQSIEVDTVTSYVTINKDPRLEVLAKKEAQINEAAASGAKLQNGYRLMLLNTNNRTLAIKIRSQLLQHFPDQKVYITYQSPYIKLKFGDFSSKKDADDYKTQVIETKIITGNIYIVPDVITINANGNTTEQPTN
ncbi:MAG: hypothetical protein WDM71_02750 [Ferruginibacter sp.]